jgi:hypothetical protein
MKQSKDVFMNNIYIKDSIKECQESEDMDPSMVFVEIILRMTEEGRAPMPLMDITRIVFELDPDIEVEDIFDGGPEPEEVFVYIEDEDGNKWFPLFTDMSEIGVEARDNAVREVPIRDILEKAIYTPGIKGIIINPHTDGMAINDKGVEFMLERADELLESDEAV